MDVRTVFLSSTYKDLVSYRQAAYEAIQRLDGWHCVRMEDFGARDWEADDFCQEKVAEADLFVGILGHLYGSIHEPSDLSYTEREYQAAVVANKPRLIFLAPEDFPVPGNLMEGTEKQARQRALRQRVCADRVVEVDWASPEQLATGIVSAIRNWEHGQAREDRSPARRTPIRADREAALCSYLRYLRTACNALPLAALSEESDPHRQAQITLDRVYIDLDTTARVPLTEEEQRERKERLAIERGEGRPLPVLEAAADRSKLVILGDPGSGKSCFVSYLAYLLAGACLGEGSMPEQWPHGALLPLRLLLRDVAPTLPPREDLERLPSEKRRLTLVKAIEEHLLTVLTSCEAEDAVPLIREALDKGQSLVIFDGLDEVAPERRSLTREAVEAFVHRHSKSRFLVTCRVRSYQEQTRLPDFAEVTLAPFDDEKIERFVRAWYEALAELGQVTKEQGKDRADNLREAVGSLAELAQNPLLLTTMGVVHTAQVELPRERGKLYQRCVEVLLRRWHKHKAGEVPVLVDLGLSESSLLAALWEIAYAAHQRGGTKEAADLPRGLVLEMLAPRLGHDYGKAQRFLQHVDERAGLLVGRGGPDEFVYTFPHRTFQEFLAGCHLALGGRHFGRRLRGLLSEGDRWALAAHLGAEHLLYNVGDVTKVLDAIYTLCPVAEPTDEPDWLGAVWAGSIATEVGVARVRADTEAPDGGAAFLARLVARLAALVQRDVLLPPERAEAGRALAQLGDPRRGVGCLDGVPAMVWCAVPTGPFTMGSKEGDEDAWKSELPQHPEGSIVKPYWISRYPVTNAQFDAFVADGGYQHAHWLKECWTEAGRAWLKERGIDGPARVSAPFELLNHPVVAVSWYEARAFCRWLTDRWQEAGVPFWLWHNGHVEELLPRPARITLQLPSEPEWEKAARGTDKRLYPWGDDFDAAKCNVDESGIGSTSAVGIFPAGDSPYGCADMSGNVLEWCNSKWVANYDKYDQGVAEREDPEGDDLRVLRGGAWYFDPWVARCAYRYANYPNHRFTDIGFRVVARVAP